MHHWPAFTLTIKNIIYFLKLHLTSSHAYVTCDLQKCIWIRDERPLLMCFIYYCLYIDIIVNCFMMCEFKKATLITTSKAGGYLTASICLPSLNKTTAKVLNELEWILQEILTKCLGTDDNIWVISPDSRGTLTSDLTRIKTKGVAYKWVW